MCLQSWSVINNSSAVYTEAPPGGGQLAGDGSLIRQETNLRDAASGPSFTHTHTQVRSH